MKLTSLILSCLFVILVAMPTHGANNHVVPQTCTILVVMSYHETYYWSISQKKAMEQTLAPHCNLVFFYLDSKRHLHNAPQKARKAWEMYTSLQPAGVIAADDNAQRFFVLPYLNNQVDVPVIFCGVNEDPATYGYPTDH